MHICIHARARLVALHPRARASWTVPGRSFRFKHLALISPAGGGREAVGDGGFTCRAGAAPSRWRPRVS